MKVIVVLQTNDLDSQNFVQMECGKGGQVAAFLLTTKQIVHLCKNIYKLIYEYLNTCVHY